MAPGPAVSMPVGTAVAGRAAVAVLIAVAVPVAVAARVAVMARVAGNGGSVRLGHGAHALPDAVPAAVGEIVLACLHGACDRLAPDHGVDAAGGDRPGHGHGGGRRRNT